MVNIEDHRLERDGGLELEIAGDEEFHLSSRRIARCIASASELLLMFVTVDLQ